MAVHLTRICIVVAAALSGVQANSHYHYGDDVHDHHDHDLHDHDHDHDHTEIVHPFEDQHAGHDHTHPSMHLRRQLVKKEPSCGMEKVKEKDKIISANVQKDWEDYHGENRVRKLQSFSATIPVYFHVIQRDATYGALSDTQRNSMMTTLNKGFNGTGFKFEFRGSDVTINSYYFDCNTNRANTLPLTTSLRKGGTDAINLYVCDVEKNKTVGTTGWATLPSQVWWDINKDGIFITNPSTSQFGLVSAGYTLVHEVGHMLGGLLHTFEGGCSSDVKDNSNFKVSGDGVADTPAHAGPTQKLSGLSQCWLSNPPIDTCPDTAGIDPGVDPVKNFMNYLSSSCLEKHGEFTTGQIARMVAHYEVFRKPDKKMTCGCPYSCTDAILNTPVGTSGHTCRSYAELMMKNNNYNEPNGCYNAALRYPTQCGACNPWESPCNVFVPATSTASVQQPSPTGPVPTKSPTRRPTMRPSTMRPTKKPTTMPAKAPTPFPTTSPPRTVRWCGLSVVNKCTCAGTETCMKRIIDSRCFPPKDSFAKTVYVNNVLARVRELCKV